MGRKRASRDRGRRKRAQLSRVTPATVSLLDVSPSLRTHSTGGESYPGSRWETGQGICGKLGNHHTRLYADRTGWGTFAHLCDVLLGERAISHFLCDYLASLGLSVPICKMGW